MVMTLTLVRQHRAVDGPGPNEGADPGVNVALVRRQPPSMFVHGMFFAVLGLPHRPPPKTMPAAVPFCPPSAPAPRPGPAAALRARGPADGSARPGHARSRATEIPSFEAPAISCFAYTDGLVTEALAPGGALFGDDRLQALSRRTPAPAPDATAVDAVLAGSAPSRAIRSRPTTSPCSRWGYPLSPPGRHGIPPSLAAQICTPPRGDVGLGPRGRPLEVLRGVRAAWHSPPPTEPSIPGSRRGSSPLSSSTVTGAGTPPASSASGSRGRAR
jgi:hypothetical protein